MLLLSLSYHKSIFKTLKWYVTTEKLYMISKIKSNWVKLANQYIFLLRNDLVYPIFLRFFSNNSIEVSSFKKYWLSLCKVQKAPKQVCIRYTIVLNQYNFEEMLALNNLRPRCIRFDSVKFNWENRFYDHYRQITLCAKRVQINLPDKESFDYPELQKLS